MIDADGVEEGLYPDLSVPLRMGLRSAFALRDLSIATTATT